MILFNLENLDAAVWDEVLGALNLKIAGSRVYHGSQFSERSSMMRKLLTTSVLVFCLSTFFAFAGQRVFQTGKLINATTQDRMKKGTTKRNVIFTVQIQGMIYTLRGGRVSPKAKDYTKGLIVGDPVQASVEGEHVILQRPDGKDIKTSILKRERVGGK